MLNWGVSSDIIGSIQVKQAILSANRQHQTTLLNLIDFCSLFVIIEHVIDEVRKIRQLACFSFHGLGEILRLKHLIDKL